MKPIAIVFLVTLSAFCLLRAEGAAGRIDNWQVLQPLRGEIGSSEVWQFPGAIYAQMRVVSVGGRMPSLDSNPEAVKSVRDWHGPIAKWRKFQLRVRYINGKSLAPTEFSFVQPCISFKGSSDFFEQGGSEMLWLFNGASVAGDIRLRLYAIDKSPRLDAIYKVASIYSSNEKLAWDVFVRFQGGQPSMSGLR
jgi:hypothetical protein